MRRKELYIYELPDWPNFDWDDTKVLMRLAAVRNLQGRLVGKMESIGFKLRDEASLNTLTLDVLKTSEIEGELLDDRQVRSSLARRLGMDIIGMVPSSRDVDGVVDMTLDAAHNFDSPVDRERLFSWHASLFPEGRSGMYNIKAGDWRDDANGPMQVVSGAFGKEKLHFEASPADCVGQQMQALIDWVNQRVYIDPVLKAAILHIWFLTIHPFEDGNGRIARALTDMLLARSDGIAQRFYSLSAQIQKKRNQYYNMLEKTQKGSLDITHWLCWFLDCLERSLKASDDILAKVLFKHRFWNANRGKVQNDRQLKIVNKLLNDFEGKLTSSKWAKIAKCSQDTALRDIQDLIEESILKRAEGGGRSTHYVLVENPGEIS